MKFQIRFQQWESKGRFLVSLVNAVDAQIVELVELYKKYVLQPEGSAEADALGREIVRKVRLKGSKIRAVAAHVHKMPRRPYTAFCLV